MKKIIVTTGQPFTDIDSLACAIAYTELLKKEGKDAEAVLPGPLNKSVTKEIKTWSLNYSQKPSTPDAKYVLVDISEPKFFATFVQEKDIAEVFDHRYGFEKYWLEKLGKESHIEMVGSCATLIWEEFKKRVHPTTISETSARLLYAAILSNTLNFKASVTTPRDKNAFEKLIGSTNLPENWLEIYFEDQEKEALLSPRKSILEDTKEAGNLIICQLEFWNSKKFISKNSKKIEKVLVSFGNKNWFFSSPSISEGKNYLFTKNPEVKELLTNLIDAKFVGDIGTTNKLWLRKEILIKLLSKKVR